MSASVSRKLILFGKYSLAVLLPKNWLEGLAQPGQTVQIKKLGRNRLIISFEPSNDAPTHPVKKTKKPTGADWLPIEPI